MSTSQSTAPRTIVAKSGMILPATITPQTDFNLMETACIVYQRFNEYKVPYATLDMIKDAMRDGSAVVTLYADAKGEIAARCLWPSSVTLSKENQITCKAYCTLRREWRSFRLDRMLACHELTTPDDILADDEPHQDWEDSPQGRALVAR
jgi:predicted DNA-binding transcriptional regulator YafY